MPYCRCWCLPQLRQVTSVNPLAVILAAAVKRNEGSAAVRHQHVAVRSGLAGSEIRQHRDGGELDRAACLLNIRQRNHSRHAPLGQRQLYRNQKSFGLEIQLKPHTVRNPFGTHGSLIHAAGCAVLRGYIGIAVGIFDVQQRGELHFGRIFDVLAIGHPLGCTGNRFPGRLIVQRHNGGRQIGIQHKAVVFRHGLHPFLRRTGFKANRGFDFGASLIGAAGGSHQRPHRNADYRCIAQYAQADFQEFLLFHRLPPFRFTSDGFRYRPFR